MAEIYAGVTGALNYSLLDAQEAAEAIALGTSDDIEEDYCRVLSNLRIIKAIFRNLDEYTEDYKLPWPTPTDEETAKRLRSSRFEEKQQ